MGSAQLDYRLLDRFQKPDKATEAVIILTVENLLAFASLFNQEAKPEVVVDNNAIALRTPASKMITAAAYVPHSKALYLYSPTTVSMVVPLPKTLEEMTRPEITEIASKDYIGAINAELLVVLREYVLERAK